MDFLTGAIPKGAWRMAQHLASQLARLFLVECASPILVMLRPLLRPGRRHGSLQNYAARRPPPMGLPCINNTVGSGAQLQGPVGL